VPSGLARVWRARCDPPVARDILTERWMARSQQERLAGSHSQCSRCLCSGQMHNWSVPERVFRSRNGSISFKSSLQPTCPPRESTAAPGSSWPFGGSSLRSWSESAGHHRDDGQRHQWRSGEVPGGSMDDYLSKPITRQSLAGMLSPWLGVPTGSHSALILLPGSVERRPPQVPRL
jgi:hypothetical protein